MIGVNCVRMFTVFCLFVWMVEGGVDGWEGTSDKALGLNIRSGRVAALAAPPTSPEPEGDTSVVIRGPQGRARGRIHTSTISPSHLHPFSASKRLRGWWKRGWL